MSTQSTFGDIADALPETDESATNPTSGTIELPEPRAVEAGAQLMLDTAHWEPDRAYEVTEVRSNSLDATRGDKTVTLRHRGGSWFHGNTDFEQSVYLLAPANESPLRCAECGEIVDPARFAYRCDTRRVCGGCHE